MADNNNNTNPKNQSKNPLNPGGKPGKPKFSFYWIYGIMAVIFIALTFFGNDTISKETDWGQVKTMLNNGDVEKIILVNKEIAEIYVKADKKSNYDIKTEGGSLTKKPDFSYQIGSIESFEKRVQEAQKNSPEPIFIRNETRQDWGKDIFGWVFPILLLVGVWFFIMRMMSKGGAGGGQIFNIGKSKAQLFDKESSVSVNFKDVAGLKEAKVEVMEIVDFLKKPKKYTELGGKIPKGALLVGPPGTGKTLLAKAVAGEAKVPFFSLSGSDFVEMFVGVGASRVRDLFKQAKEKAPCIIFIDEIDAIGRARGKNAMTGANDERENTLNQLLTEMDGFGSNAGVIILAATNRADILDTALLRAGRFDRQIHVELPELEERRAIFEVHTKPLKIGSHVDIEMLAKQTPGFSGADIANVCNEAALIAARQDKKQIEKQDFFDAIDRIIGGLEKRSKIINKQEKEVIAYHESGHATVSWLLEHAHPLVKVTIVPRGKALGAAWYVPEERQITTKEQMMDEMCATLGGRAAEQVIFNKISTGALNDLEKVSKQAFNMVAFFGLNDKLGNISYYDSSGQQEYQFQKPYSEKTAQVIDFEVSKLIEEAYKRALDLLDKNKDKLSMLANVLMEKEVIFREDLEKIFGSRSWDEGKDHLMINRGNENESTTEAVKEETVEAKVEEPKEEKV
ncbi:MULTISPECIES: ATP-dependent zinc metalloprotease FtsH [unclassified Lentimicrobium]|uniref:ATP-dependent zinc metalloprotease FtsH n=1 Tax=unclassified Lentimicrobium TaxID=2677434 RepID=UPI0015538310|nr:MULTISPECIES: ATP-dependent zinc metalloprotease FtsH [unclassified Lentimicrobium]NPD44529.1 ATP-dependent zinc metalloprotease FtsH [Lentimicrobium sp. S6]NPD85654.1 ATP-dependent zinc metalloprotease FtsH [Lentimicrobium sp. L6]